MEYLINYVVNGYPYIHSHKDHIQQGANTKGIYEQYYNQAKEQLRFQYNNLFKESLNIKISNQNQTLDSLAKIMEIDENGLIKILNQQLQEELQSSINVNKLKELHNNIKDKQFKTIFESILNNKDSKKGVQEFNQILTIIGDCLQLIETGEESLGALILELRDNSNISNLKGLGKKLHEQLEKYKIKNNYKTIKKETLKASVQQLENLAFSLETEKFRSDKKKDLTAEGLVTLLVNGLISTQFAEGIAFIGNEVGKNTANNNILTGVKAQRAGTKSVEQNFIEDSSLSKIIGKTDILLPNVKIKFQVGETGKDTVVFTFDIGISSKFYKNNSFNDIEKEKAIGTISSGSGGQLGIILSSILSNSEDFHKYLMYNHMSYETEYTEDLNAILATKSIIRLFSSAGSKDFSHFLLINGKIIPVLSLVEYAIENKLTASLSQKDNTQAILISIPNRKDFVYKDKMPLEQSAWERSKEQKRKIDFATFKAELRLNKLAEKYYKTN